MLPFYRRRLLRPLPPYGAKLCVVGDSIQDQTAWVGTATVGNQCGLSTVTLAAALGMTMVGLSASQIFTAPGTLYTTNPTPTFTGGAPTRAAVATATVVAGGVRGLTFSDFGAGYGSVPALGFTGGGGSGAAGTLTISGGAVVAPIPNGGSSTDGNRSAIAGGTTQVRAGSVDLLTTYTARCLAYNPDAILLMTGMNDYLFADATITAVAFRAALDTIIPALVGSGTHPQVFVCGVLPATLTPFGGTPPWATSAADALRQLNTHLAECASAHGATYLSTAAFPAANTVDGVHPTTTGHKWLSDRFIAVLSGRD